MDLHAIPIRDLAYVVIAAITGGLIAWRLRLPIIIGYVLAGMAISPLTPGPSVHDIHSIELFTEIGVVLLMFSAGLEFSLKELLKAKWVAFIGGPMGIAISILMGLGAGSLLGWLPSKGIVLGAVISVASTMVLTRLLIDQGQLRTAAGRIMVAITLVEDLARIREYLRNFRHTVEFAQPAPARPRQAVPEVREVAVLNSIYAGQSLRDARLREAFGVTIVSIRRSSGESLTNPPADAILHLNDRLRVLGPSDEIDAFAAKASENNVLCSDSDSDS
jgi:K+/H+ antiporter YhaU regulatory subunit KhtT